MTKIKILLAAAAMLLLFTGCSDAPAATGETVGTKRTDAEAAPAEPVLVAEATDFADVTARGDNAFQDIRHWSYGDAMARNLPDPDREGNTGVKYYVSRDTVEAYVRMLTENGFTLEDAYEFSYKSDPFLSWALRCNTLTDAETFGSQYENVPCHVNVWSSKKGEYHVEYSTALTMCDLGMRQDGATADLTPQGASAGAGLYRLADGSYRTADGRLSAKVGGAAVIRDGETLAGKARYEQYESSEGVWIEEYAGAEGIYFRTKADTVQSGDVFLAADTERLAKNYHTKDKYDITGFRWDEPLFLMECGDGWYGPTVSSATNRFETLTVRVMYYEKNGDAVYYIYARTPDSTPAEIEVLCAVNTSPVEKTDAEPNSSGVYEDGAPATVSVGETITLRNNAHTFDSDYHVYEWKIAEGENLIDISSGGNECTVTAKAAGTAVVSCKYSYTEETEDVLTGIPRTAHKSRTTRFTITIE